MVGKSTIIGCLLPAYVLLVLHAIVPHHHHYGSAEDSFSYHHALSFQQDDPESHHDDHDTDCCDKAHNYAHAPEEGEAMISSDLIRINLFFVKAVPGFLAGLKYNDAIEVGSDDQFVNPANRQYNVFVSKSHAHRGPPIPEMMA